MSGLNRNGVVFRWQDITHALSITVVYMCFSFLMVIPMYVCRIVLLGFIMLTPFVVYLTVVDLTIPAFSILPPPPILLSLSRTPPFSCVHRL